MTMVTLSAASLAKKLRRVWTQHEAHNVIRAMATKRERTTKRFRVEGG